MADCLTLLRQYNLQKKEIVERDGLIIFDQTAWPGNAKTNYPSYRSGQAGLKEYYTLESLLFLLKNVSLSHPSYVAKAG
ncbi:Parafibromin, partial [Geodia barretti]